MITRKCGDHEHIDETQIKEIIIQETINNKCVSFQNNKECLVFIIEHQNKMSNNKIETNWEIDYWINILPYYDQFNISKYELYSDEWNKEKKYIINSNDYKNKFKIIHEKYENIMNNKFIDVKNLRFKINIIFTDNSKFNFNDKLFSYDNNTFISH